jgi:hypothetical protein
MDGRGTDGNRLWEVARMESHGERRGRAQGEKPGAVSGHELLAGAPLPLQMNLQVEITRAGADGEPADLPRGLDAELLKHEDKLFTWLGRNPGRRAEFLADPVKSLRAAGIKLDEPTLATLAERQRQTAATDVVPPGLTIRSLDVTVAAKRPPERKTSSKARKTTTKAGKPATTPRKQTSRKKSKGA